MFVLIGDDYFNTDAIACVRPVDDGDEQTIIFTAGQSAIDGGFLLDVPTGEVFSIIQNARLHEIALMLDADADTNTEAESAYRTPNTEAASPVSSADERDD